MNTSNVFPQILENPFTYIFTDSFSIVVGIEV